MAFDPRIETLGGYAAHEFVVECVRCRRRACVERDALFKRYGNISLIECARHIAAAKGCTLANLPDALCSVRVFELPIWTWGKLRDAQRGGWRATLTCRRRDSGMKATESCPGSYALDLDTMLALFGEDYPLSRVDAKAKCPRCRTSSVRVEWQQVPPPKDPAPAQEDVTVLRLKPTGAAVGRKRFGVIEGRRTGQ